jgi:hypothetical protein
LPRKRPEAPAQPPLPELPDRINVFDGDEFDVNARSVIDKSKVHRGKKRFAAKNANALLDDKRDLAGTRGLA